MLFSNCRPPVEIISADLGEAIAAETESRINRGGTAAALAGFGNERRDAGRAVEDTPCQVALIKIEHRGVLRE